MTRTKSLLLSGWVLALYLGAGTLFAFLLYGNEYTTQALIFDRAATVSKSEALTISTHILTGGNPIAYADQLQAGQRYWVTSWCLHVVGWVYIPALVGVIVGRLVYAAGVSGKRRELEKRLEQWADAEGLTGDRKKGFVRDVLRDVDEQAKQQQPQKDRVDAASG